MPSVVVDDIFKAYANVEAVSGVSFKIEEGEVFGLLGPNGAGKSTIIRLILDFIEPDKGKIEVLGGKFSEKTKEQVGYLPEERGLYEDITVMDNLLYLAGLKGMNAFGARKKAIALLERVGLKEKAKEKVNALSKGMRQLAQICATLIHEPALLIFDEPFSGLDPNNRELVKQIIKQEKKAGRTIILSTHMMNEAEEICDRVLMINNGRRVLYGDVENVKNSYASHSIFVEFEGSFPQLSGVEKADVRNNSAELSLRIDTDPQGILRQLVDSGVIVRKFDVKELSLNQIFIRVVEAEKWIKQ